MSRIQLAIAKSCRVSLCEQPPKKFFFDRTPKGVGKVCLKFPSQYRTGRLHKSAALVCGARAQNQATKLFRFFREDDGYNETFAAAKW